MIHDSFRVASPRDDASQRVHSMDEVECEDHRATAARTSSCRDAPQVSPEALRVPVHGVSRPAVLAGRPRVFPRRSRPARGPLHPQVAHREVRDEVNVLTAVGRRHAQRQVTSVTLLRRTEGHELRALLRTLQI